MNRHRQLLAELEKRCEEAAIPVTLQRRAVLETLLSHEDHPTADEIAADLARRLDGVSRATVYRTLETLAERGLVVRVSHPGAAVRYDIKVHRHHHLVCELCGSITDFDNETLDGVELPDLTRAGFQAHDFSVHVRGVCKDCARDRERDKQ